MASQVFKQLLSNIRILPNTMNSIGSCLRLSNNLLMKKIKTREITIPRVFYT